MPGRAFARRALGRSPATRAALRGLERAESARVVYRSGAFDRFWYESQVGRRFAGTAAAVAHYVASGRRDGASPHPLFEPAWFARQQPRRSAADPFAVFLLGSTGTGTGGAGGGVGRPPTPHPLFDAELWASWHPESRRHVGGPLGHFAATAGPATPLPVPAGAPVHGGTRRAGWTWGPARERLLRARLGQAGPQHAPENDLEPADAADPLDAVTVVVPAGDAWQDAWSCVERVLAAGGPDGLRVLVAGGGGGGAAGALQASLAGTDPRVQHLPVAGGPVRSLAAAVPRVQGRVAVLLDRAARVDDGAWLPALVDLLDEPAVLGASCVLLAPDGTVRSAGATFPARGVLPADLLAGHPPEDACRLGGQVEVAAVAAGALAVRTEDLAACGGPQADAAPGLELVDLCLRMATRRAGRFVVRTSVRLRTEAPVAPIGDENGDGDGDGDGGDVRAARTRFRRTWADVPRTDADAVRPAGFRVAHYVPADEPGVPADVRSAVPVLVRAAPVPAGDGTPALRWALKTAVPSGERARLWGDLHFAAALAAALERAGQQVAVDHREAADRVTSALDDVVLVVRGRARVAPQPGAVNLLWVISHPELVTDEEMAAFDAVFAASEAWAAYATARSGVEVTPLLQATDSRLFRPEGASPDSGDPVLFVGNSRGVYRPVVRHLVEAGEDVAVYGGRWERFLPAGYVRAPHVPNAELPGRYRAAGVVLNDHWDDMRDEGFVSNRLFDAAATGARVLTDDVAGAEELFGGLVRVWRDAAELRRLVRDREAAFPPSGERDRLAREVLARHSFDERAGVLRATALRLWERREVNDRTGGQRRLAREETP